MNQPLVIKFGGTSVGDGAGFVRVAKIAADAAQDGPATVVVSAMSGTTDTLLGYAEAATGSTARTSTGATHEGSIAELHRTLSERHLKAAREAVSQEFLPEVEGRLLALLERLTNALAAPSEDTDAWRAAIAVFGERLSAEVLAGTISSLGVPAAVVSEDPIATDSEVAESEVDAGETQRRCSRSVAPLLDEGVIPVVPGYVGRTPDGRPTTLGRGGSDLSATVLGHALGAREVWIMSDVDGVMDADPRLVPGASLLPRLSYREATTFATLGAKVLHHKTMEPALEAGMEVLVKNTFNPDSPGTLVSAREDGSGVRCVALRRSFKFEVPCIQGYKSEAAAVICIGSPEEADAVRGRQCLREAGIPLFHYGIAAAGLVFVVPREDAQAALVALHGALVAESAQPLVQEGA